MKKNRTRTRSRKIIEEEPHRERRRKFLFEEPYSGVTRKNQKLERRET
jgi:hypothetical protein